MITLPKIVPAEVTFSNVTDVFNKPKKSEAQPVAFDVLSKLNAILTFLIVYDVYDDIPAIPPAYTCYVLFVFISATTSVLTTIFESPKIFNIKLYFVPYDEFDSLIE